MSSQVLWFVSRGSGLALLAGFSAVAVLGIAARLGSLPRAWSRLGLGELHRALALFCVAFLVLHVLKAIVDPYVRIGWAATVLPFASPYRATAIGLGALAVDLGGAVLITSLARRRLGYRAWRAAHWLGYLAWPAAFWHSVTAGTDLRIWWVALVVWSCAAAVATACLARLLSWAARSRPPASRHATVGRAPGKGAAVTRSAVNPRPSVSPSGAGAPGALPRLLPVGLTSLDGHLARYGQLPRWAPGGADRGGRPGRAHRPGRGRVPRRAQAGRGGGPAQPGGDRQRHRIRRSPCPRELVRGRRLSR